MKSTFVIVLLLLAASCGACVIPRNKQAPTGMRTKSARKKSTSLSSKVTLDERTNCTAAGAPIGDQPLTRSDTTAQVSSLLSDMTTRGYDAFIVVSGDAHQSEYVDGCDERVAYISGFIGSAGTAVILKDGQRALWTDGRYFLAADDQLGCEWLLMKDGQEGVPTVGEWIISELTAGAVVAADGRMVDANSWLSFTNELAGAGMSTVTDTITDGNSILDAIWNADGRPACSNKPIYVHPIEYAGVTWQQKIADVEVEMTNYGAEAYIITMLDETAWTLNIRGADIPYNPVFPSYIIVDRSSGSPAANVSLFIKDKENKVPADVLTHLGVGMCTDPAIACVDLVDYDTIETAITNLNSNPSVTQILTPSAYSDAPGVSFYIYNLIDSGKRLSAPSPVYFTKAAKNPTEVAAMKNAHIKDAVALMSYLSFMDSEMALGKFYTEISGMLILDDLRTQQEGSKGLSFDTISAYGSNGAIIHYAPVNETDVQIGTDSLYLLDSGGQYLDGTTDVTRTLYYGDAGTADPKMVDAYTRVLMGQIDFATLVFPKGTAKYYIDLAARKALYDVGMDYRHGTSHGVGLLLNVHEGSDTDFELGFFGSDEPGYYEDGSFGVRLENVVTTVAVSTKYDFSPVSYTFETVTVVPYEPKLIDTSIMSTAQCEYLNSYHMMVQNKTTAELLGQNLTDVYDWMITKTQPLACP